MTLNGKKTVFDRIQRDDLSVRAVEDLVRSFKQNGTEKNSTKSRKSRPVLTFDEQQVQADLKLKFGHQTVLKRNVQGGGKIELNYSDAVDLDRILTQLGL